MKNRIKKLIEFIKNVFWILKGKKCHLKPSIEEEIFMLNKKYLNKYSGRKKYVKCPKIS